MCFKGWGSSFAIGIELGCERKRRQGFLQGFWLEKLVELIFWFLRWWNCRRNRFGGGSPVLCFEQVKLELPMDYSKWCWVWNQSSEERLRVEIPIWEPLTYGDFKARSRTGKKQACLPLGSVVGWSQVKPLVFPLGESQMSVYRGLGLHFFRKDFSLLSWLGWMYLPLEEGKVAGGDFTISLPSGPCLIMAPHCAPWRKSRPPVFT